MFKKAITILMALCLLAGCAGCASTPASGTAADAPQTGAAASGTAQADTVTITDLYGRQVTLPREIKSIVCTGAGALRMICYAQAQDLVIGAEDSDKTQTIKRGYNYVNNDIFKDLPSIGKGGGRGYTAYEEEIIALAPDVIFSAYNSEALEELASKTGIPAVAITYDSGMFDEKLFQSLELIGQLLGKQERCDQLTDALKAAQQDLSARTQDIADADKPTAYSGAVTFSGGHGFEGTYANFPPFTAIGAKNVVDETGLDGSLQIDLEKVLVWDPEVIFLDPGNMDLVNEQYDKNPTYFQSLQAVQNGEVYSMISYNNYTTNVELAVADAYYAGTVMFPEQFADIDIEQKADELFELFLGKPIYSDMQAAGLSFGKITIGE